MKPFPRRCIAWCVALLLLPAPVQLSSQIDRAGYADAMWLDGTIGGTLQVRVYFGLAGPPKEGGLWGMYYYTSIGTPIPLDGECVVDPDCLNGRIRLVEGDPREDGPKPIFELDVKAKQVTGTWTSADGKRRLPVQLRPIAKPSPYEVAISQGRTRRFSDPRWPVEFDYPQGWLLQTTATTLTLRPPDPEAALYDERLECERGSEVPVVPQRGEPAPVLGNFFLTRDGWRASPGSGLLAGSCGEDPGECTTPETRKSRGVATMMGPVAYRSFTPGVTPAWQKARRTWSSIGTSGHTAPTEFLIPPTDSAVSRCGQTGSKEP